MPSWKKLIVSGSDAALNSLSVSTSVTANSFVKLGGTSSQFLKADGSVDSTVYQPLLTNPVTGTGVSGQVTFWNGTNTITGSTNLTYSSGILTLTGTNGSVVLGATGDQLSFTRNGPVYISANGGASSQLYFEVNGAERWRMLATGVWQSNGAQTIQTSTGNLTLATAGGNGNVIVSPNGTGFLDSQLRTLLRGYVTVGVSTLTNRGRLHVHSENQTSPTLGNGGAGVSLVASNSDGNYGTVFFTKGNGQGSIQQMRVDGTATSYSLTLQELGGNVLIGTTTDSGDRLRVNGTVRLDSVTNATGDFVRIDANNVLRRRTAAETLADIGAQADLEIISLAELNTGTATTERSVNSKNLNDWLSGVLSGSNGYNEESLTYTTSNVFTLSQSNPTAINVYIHGQRKRPGLDYTVLGNQITFLDTLQPSFDIKVTYFYSIPGVALSGTGTANYITKWNGTTGLANSILYDTGTNAGVNETNPQARLDINGTLRVQSIPNGIGDFITTDVSGSIRRRTAAETLVDIGAVVPIHKHTQGTASTTWTVTHNLNFTNPIVTIYNSENKVIIPEEIISTSNNVVTIQFTEAVSGYATIAGGSLAVITETQALVNSLIFG